MSNYLQGATGPYDYAELNSDKPLASSLPGFKLQNFLQGIML